MKYYAADVGPAIEGIDDLIRFIVRLRFIAWLIRGVARLIGFIARLIGLQASWVAAILVLLVVVAGGAFFVWYKRNR